VLNADILPEIKNILDKSQSILVMLVPNAKYDQAASCIAVYEALAQKYPQKEITLLSPEQITTPNLLGQENFKQKLGSKDLSVSFDYDEKAVDKVSYHIDEEKKKFYLIIKPQKGQKPLNTSQVSFDYTGAEADLIFLFGVHELGQLEHLYSNYESLYNQAALVTVHNFEPEIGNFKIDLSGKSSWSEAVLALIAGLELELTSAAATNLLLSIEEATNHLNSFTATADTFEVVAKLLRAGAKRQVKSAPQPVAPTTPVEKPKKKIASKSKTVDLMKSKDYAPSNEARG